MSELGQATRKGKREQHTWKPGFVLCRRQTLWWNIAAASIAYIKISKNDVKEQGHRGPYSFRMRADLHQLQRETQYEILT